MNKEVREEEEEVPKVRCTSCDRRVRCVQVSDGTIYRPLAWKFPDEQKPLEGLCGGCRAPQAPADRAAFTQFVETQLQEITKSYSGELVSDDTKDNVMASVDSFLQTLKPPRMNLFEISARAAREMGFDVPRDIPDSAFYMGRSD